MFFIKRYKTHTFFRLENACEQVGVYPQTKSFDSDYDIQAPDSAYHLKSNTIPAFTPNFETVLLYKKAKLTDLISFFFGEPLLLHQKVKTILERHTLPRHRFYGTTLVQNQKIISDYHCFLMESKAINWLDVKQSTFSYRESNPLLKEQKTYKIAPATLDELSEAVKKALLEDLTLVREKIVLDKAVLDFDLFNLSFLLGPYLLSKRLKENLESNAVSGIEFRVIDLVIKI